MSSFFYSIILSMVDMSTSIDHVCESLIVPLCISTSVCNSLMVDPIFKEYVVIFFNSETRVDLILLDVLNFDMILVMDGLNPYHAILDYYAQFTSISVEGYSEFIFESDIFS